VPRWLRHHWLTVAVVCFAIASLVLFTWGERGYFCDQAASHHEACGGFWDSEHLHDWLYNAASNWQSELLFGVLLVILLRHSRGGDE
jgi:hypothetical protein